MVKTCACSLDEAAQINKILSRSLIETSSSDWITLLLLSINAEIKVLWIIETITEALHGPLRNRILTFTICPHTCASMRHLLDCGTHILFCCFLNKSYLLLAAANLMEGPEIKLVLPVPRRNVTGANSAAVNTLIRNQLLVLLIC